MSKKVIIINTSRLPFPPVEGGAVENLLKLIVDQNETSKDFEFHIFSIYNESAVRESSKYVVSQVTYIKLNIIDKIINRLFYKINRVFRGLLVDDILYYIKILIRITRLTQYNLILIENRPNIILLMKLLKSKRFVLHLHNDSLNEDTLHSKSIIQSYSRIITVSNYIKSRVLAINPELEDRISVVLNGIDLDKFHHFHQTKITRQTLGLRTDERVIIYFGRTIAEKGFHVLLESFRKIETENCCLLIIGSNWYGSAERESIDTSIFEDASKKKRVIFTGYIDYDLVPKYLSVGDIAVLPSIWEEPAGLVIIEALASGLPTITTISGGIPEYTSTNLSVLINRDNHLSDNISRAIDIMFQNDKKLANLSSLGIMHSMKFSKQIFYTNFVKAMMNE